MANRKKRQGLSWELIGLVAVLGVIAVALVVYAANAALNPKGSTEPEPPVALTLDPALGLDKPEMSGEDEDGRPFVGRADAPVTVYEFADFQCPHCRDYALYVSKAMKQDLIATGKARFVFVGMPFMGDGSPTDESVLAQRAARCAAAQGRFWPMHDWLFTNQATVANTGGFNRGRLDALAAKVGLDAAAFTACMSDPATQELVQRDKDFGVSKSVGSTPSFMIKGADRLYEGVDKAQLQGLRDAIEAGASGNG